MKLLIASDIHGSALYCGELLKAYDREKADRLLLLGDVLYHGPRNDLPDGYAPKEVIMFSTRTACRRCSRETSCSTATPTSPPGTKRTASCA